MLDQNLRLNALFKKLFRRVSRVGRSKNTTIGIGIVFCFLKARNYEYNRDREIRRVDTVCMADLLNRHSQQ